MLLFPIAMALAASSDLLTMRISNKLVILLIVAFFVVAMGISLPIEQVAERWIVGSDPDETVEKIGAYLDAGFNHLVFHAPGHDQERFMAAFERDLAPRLRARA